MSQKFHYILSVQESKGNHGGPDQNERRQQNRFQQYVEATLYGSEVSGVSGISVHPNGRITVTFCKKYDLPIEKFFNASLLKKFPWAMYAKSDFVW